MKDLVRGNIDGEPLLCCWDDCGQYGDNRIQEVRLADKKTGGTVTYIFCSPGHRDFWKNSAQSYGNHTAGNRTPAGLIIPSGRLK